MPPELRSKIEDEKTKERLKEKFDRKIAEAEARLRALEAEERYAVDQRARDEIVATLEQSKTRCQSLAGFVREAWHVLEPDNPYVHGWHIDAICQHLEAVTFGKINRLLINVPPGTAKSMIVSVFWPAWEWGPCGKPSMRYLTASYSESYAKRDARKMRDLVASEWFQARWATELVRAGETSFENTSHGNREAKPMSSMTGGRGDRVIIDDPHSTEQAESDAERETTTRIFRESVTSRLNSAVRSAIVVIMQRLHSSDISGVILALKLNYVHLRLPMEFEADNPCTTSLGFRDPRTIEGELLFPERYPPEVVERDKNTMGPYAVAGQFQQRPSPREGGLFKRSYFGIIRAAPVGTKWVRHWDLAASKKKRSAWTAGLKLGRAPDGTFIIGDVQRFQEEGHVVRQRIKNIAEHDGYDVEISLPQDPGQAGLVQARDFVSMLAGFRVVANPETGDKETRAEPAAAQAGAGNMKIIAGPWNEAFLSEAELFPNGNKDQIDALSGAFGRLVGKRQGVPNIVIGDDFHRENPFVVGGGDDGTGGGDYDGGQ